MNEILKQIATDILKVPTLETQNRDSLDFHEMHVATLREALVAAYAAGKSAGRNPKPKRKGPKTYTTPIGGRRTKVTIPRD